MKGLKEIVQGSKLALRTNAPTILIGMGVSGTLTTAYLSAKAGYRSAQRLSEKPAYLTSREKVELTWDLFVPPFISGGATIGCVILGARAHSKRAAAAYSLLAVTERAFEEYREKVVETIGQNKEQAVRDEIAQDRVNANPPSVILGSDNGVICFEHFTGRYFKSDMEALRKAQNDINAKIISNLYVTMDEFYYILGIPGTTNSNRLGWDSHRLLELEFSSVLGPEGKPCLSFEYNYVKNL